MKQVKIGVGLGLWPLGMPTAKTILRVARHAEDWRLDSFWLSDHLLAPPPELDVVATLSMLAAATSRIKLGPSVLLLNLRHPLVAAKAFASLDYLSEGRIVLAVGTGANLADYTACGIPTEGRGRRLDEGIQVLRTVWREENACFHGRYFNFDNVSLEPRPATRSHNDFGTIDIWIGGRSEAALQRTAKLGDGYFGSFLTPEECARNIARIRNYAAECGRANGRIEFGLTLFCRIARSRAQAAAAMAPMVRAFGDRSERFLERSVFGSSEDIIERLAAYIAIGLDKFVLWPVAGPDDWAEQVEIVGREIASHFIRAAA